MNGEGGNECFIQNAEDGDYIVDRIKNEDYPAPIIRCRKLLTNSGNGFECPQLKEEEIVIFLNEISSLAYAFIKGDSELILQFARSEKARRTSLGGRCFGDYHGRRPRCAIPKQHIHCKPSWFNLRHFIRSFWKSTLFVFILILGNCS